MNASPLRSLIRPSFRGLVRPLIRPLIRPLAAGVVAVVALGLGATGAWAISPTPASTWGTNGRVAAVLPVSGKVVIGGTFSAVVDTAGRSYPAANLAVLDATTGVVDRSWAGSTDGEVLALAVSGSTLYVGGNFRKLDGQPRRNLGALSLATGQLVGAWKADADRPVEALAATGSTVFAGGRFGTVTDASGAKGRPYVAAVSAGSGAVTSWSVRPDDMVSALVTSSDGSTLYLGGAFRAVNGTSRRSTAAVTTSGAGALTAFRGSATNAGNYAPVLDLALSGPTLYVAAAGSGGGCTAMNATTGAQIWSKHANGNVQAVRVFDGVAYCGGHFGGSGGFAGLVRYKIAGVSTTAPYGVTSFAPRINSALGVWALGADAGRLYLGGDFTKVAGKAANHYAVFPR